MTTVKKNPARKPRQATSDMEKIIDVEPISKPGSPQVEVHEISTKVQRAEDSQAEALRDIITRDIADGRMGEAGSYLDTVLASFSPDDLEKVHRLFLRHSVSSGEDSTLRRRVPLQKPHEPQKLRETEIPSASGAAQIAKMGERNRTAHRHPL